MQSCDLWHPCPPLRTSSILLSACWEWRACTLMRVICGKLGGEGRREASPAPLQPFMGDKGKRKGKGKGKNRLFFSFCGRILSFKSFATTASDTKPSKHRKGLPELSQTDFMHLIYANTAQNKLNIANYINNLNCEAKNSQEYLQHLEVFTCKFYKFCYFFFPEETSQLINQCLPFPVISY